MTGFVCGIFTIRIIKSSFCRRYRIDGDPGALVRTLFPATADSCGSGDGLFLQVMSGDVRFGGRFG